MAIYEPSEDAFWDRRPDFLRALSNLRPGLRSTYFLLGDESLNPPTAVVLDMEPGHVIARHAHACERVEVVLRGTLDAGDGRLRGPGTVMTAHAHEPYGPHIAGPDGCQTVEIFGNLTAVYQPIYETSDGPKVMNFLDEENAEVPIALEGPPEIL